MILITATGRDKPGMVAALSQKLFDANCNIEDATMTRLSGEFAMILVVVPPRDLSTPELAARLESLRESHGLHIGCDDFDGDAGAGADAAPRFMLSVYGPDRTGLVACMARVLASHDVNITDLQTRVAVSHTVYVMLFELELPPALDVEILRAALDEAATEMGVEYSLRALDEDAL
jgi:glycine cleavage system transcriptional repressor